HKTLLWCFAILCTVNMMLMTLILALPCRPVRAQWDATIVEKKCLDSWLIIHICVYASAFSAFLDVYSALYPAAVFWKLISDSRKKIALSLMLGLGAM
ncbi:uncharacterized protein BCR38DRAFT_324837, partial [Pseudomassariella vexata]